MCSRDVVFELLVKLHVDVEVIGVICGSCGHEVLAEDPAEREKLTHAAKLWRQQEDGALAPDEFAAALDSLESTSLHRIIAEARTWSCPRCPNENPIHFVTCWNCGYERPLTAEESALEPGEPFEEA